MSPHFSELSCKKSKLKLSSVMNSSWIMLMSFMLLSIFSNFETESEVSSGIRLNLFTFKGITLFYFDSGFYFFTGTNLNSGTSVKFSSSYISSSDRSNISRFKSGTTGFGSSFVLKGLRVLLFYIFNIFKYFCCENLINIIRNFSGKISQVNLRINLNY